MFSRKKDDEVTPATTRTGDDAPTELASVSREAGPDNPARLGGRGVVGALRRTAKQFSADSLTDWAAALTYYGVLSIFPGILVIVSVLGLIGGNGQKTVQDAAHQLAPNGQLRQLVDTVLDQVKQPGSAGIAAIIGIVLAFWSASGYVAAFMRASNTIYDIEEGRPIWKTAPIRLGVTIVLVLLLVVCAVAVVFTGELAQQAGNVIGLGSTFLTVWSIAKWPVLLAIVSFMFALLYWASPNAKQPGFRWVTAGGVVGVVLWLIASVGFAFYVASFGSYNKTYGALAGVIVFLVWLWISNVATLLGAEFNAELERGRQIEGGHPAEVEPFVEPRDTKKMSDEGKAQVSNR